VGKHSRIAPTAEQAFDRDDDSPLIEQIEPVLRRQLSLLEQLAAACVQTFADGGANPALLREASGVSRSIVSLSSEIRARDKVARQQLMELNADAVIGWAKLQTPAARARLVRDVVALDETKKKSVLG
jgi:hypothetical protein